MDTEEYRKKLEEEILKIIEERLKAGQMNAKRAQEIAGYVLDSLHPHMTLDEIHKAVQNFDDHFPELVKVVIPVANEYEQKIKQIVTEQVRHLIKETMIDEANALLKQATNKELNISE